MATPPVTLLALATAVPPHRLEQPAVAEFARRIYAKSFARYPELADVFVNAGIERRYSVRPLEWFAAPHDWSERNDAYLAGAGELFIRAAQAALDRAGMAARDVDVIVTVSSIGIATPSLEARVGARAGVRSGLRGRRFRALDRRPARAR
jgi:alkylresorcinol/alkylpyrone synthase